MSSSTNDKPTIFLVGLDEFNLRQLNRIPSRDRYNFRELLSFDFIKDFENASFDRLLEEARSVLDAHPGSIDAIITHWDLPATSMQAILAKEYNTRGASLESTLKCEHKYWSRAVQAELDLAPCAFQAIDPFDSPSAEQLEVDFPFWLKPVRGTDSELGFKIDSAETLNQALEQTRQEIGSIAEMFNQILKFADLPEKISEVDGHWCIAEEFLSGSQHTVSGYVQNGKAHTYGVVDSINYPDTDSFQRYEYPSSLPEEVAEEMCETSKKVMEHIGLDDSPFNIEFFWDDKKNKVSILEINPRISQSHGDIYKKVDGESNEHLLIELALGHEPRIPHREGKYNFAAKFYHRVFEDAEVKRVPSGEELARLEKEFDAFIHVVPSRGQRLSELPEQDTASFVLAEVFLGARDRDDLVKTFEEVTSRLNFRLE